MYRYDDTELQNLQIQEKDFYGQANRNKYTNIQVYNYTVIQIGSYIVIQLYRYVDI